MGHLDQVTIWECATATSSFSHIAQQLMWLVHLVTGPRGPELHIIIADDLLRNSIAVHFDYLNMCGAIFAFPSSIYIKGSRPANFKPDRRITSSFMLPFLLFKYRVIWYRNPSSYRKC